MFDAVITGKSKMALTVAPIHTILLGADIDANLAKIEDRLCFPLLA